MSEDPPEFVRKKSSFCELKYFNLTKTKTSLKFSVCISKINS